MFLADATKVFGLFSCLCQDVERRLSLRSQLFSLIFVKGVVLEIQASETNGSLFHCWLFVDGSLFRHDVLNCQFIKCRLRIRHRFYTTCANGDVHAGVDDGNADLTFQAFDAPHTPHIFHKRNFWERRFGCFWQKTKRGYQKVD